MSEGFRDRLDFRDGLDSSRESPDMVVRELEEVGAYNPFYTRRAAEIGMRV